jgi:hypothetical protein
VTSRTTRVLARWVIQVVAWWAPKMSTCRLHRTPLIGHAVDGVGHAGGQRDVQHVVASAVPATDRLVMAACGGKVPAGAGATALAGHPGRGVGRQLHTQCSPRWPVACSSVPGGNSAR